MALPVVHSASTGSYLCLDCQNLFDRVDHQIQGGNFKDGVWSYIEQWKSPEEVELSAENGCRLCAFLAGKLTSSRGQDETSEDARRGLINRPGLKLAANLFVDDYELKEGRIWFLYSEEKDITPDMYRYLMGTLDVKRQIEDQAAKPPQLTVSTDSNETFDHIQQWLRICDMEHRCLRWNVINGQVPALPVRLLSIDASGDDSIVCLVSSEDLPSDTKYLTLSHRWGTNMPLQLSKPSLPRFQKGVLLSELPPTFRDVVKVAFRLSLRYLWIDTLCILQDSKDDWAAQAKEMAAVYSNSYLNIAASDSADSFGGLFRERDLVKVQSFELRSSEDIHYLCYENTFIEDVSEDSCLRNRAWTVQERYLSPRVLHFGKHQLHWECLHHTTSESLNVGLSFSASRFTGLKSLDFAIEDLETGATKSSQQSVYDLWDRLLGHYTAGELTYVSDKAIAAHSLASTICRHLGEDPESAYVNGLWRKEFVDGLLWHSFGRRSEKSYHLDNGACSWSWLSMSGRVFSHYQTYSTKVTKLIDVKADCTLLSPTATAGGYAKVQGPLCRVIFRQTKSREAWRDLPEDVVDKFYSLEVGGQMLYHLKTIDIRPDDDDPDSVAEETERQLYLLLCRSQSVPSMSNDDSERPEDSERPYNEAVGYECLLLQPVDTKPGHFIRTGYVHFHKMKYAFVTESHQECMNISLATCRLLDSQFRSYDVAPNLYHSVDDDYMYTITLI